MSENKFYLDILSDYKDKFKNHIDIEDNYRTIFSGIFGSGKTTFLKEFFQIENIKKDYEVIHLFPVNYSITSNEDIFELIKFDIFYRLLLKDIEFDINEIGLDITVHQFIINNYTDILLPFLSFIPEVGGNIKELAEKCLKLKNQFEKYYSSVQENQLSEISKFLDDFSKKKGTIYETDFYTELIIHLLSKLKKNNKKVILIIDDLDRIDPEHIFRLLNIFSAHTDIQGDESNYNKFDIDKIIFVCDTENIRNIFKTKFGVQTDFNGYIDKFYSKQIFQFKIYEILNMFKSKIKEGMRFSNENHSNASLGDDNEFSDNFIFILEHLFLNNKISLRDLKRVCSSSIELPSYNLKKIGYSRYWNINFNIIQLYDVFNEIYGKDKVKLLEAFSSINRFLYDDERIKYFLEDILLLMYMINNVSTFYDTVMKEPIVSEIDNVTFKISRANSRHKNFECEIINYQDIKNSFQYFDSLYSLFKIMANRE